MTAILINPNLIVQRNDRFTTGVVYMPVGLAYIASALRKAKLPIKVIDAFGEAPLHSKKNGKFLWMGLTVNEIIHRIPDDVCIVYIFANQVLNHNSLEEIVKGIKSTFPYVPIVILENTQAVTAYSLKSVSHHLFACGADYILTGEAENKVVKLTSNIINGFDLDQLNIDGLFSRTLENDSKQIKLENETLRHNNITDLGELDDLPFPAWDLFPISNYWKLRFGHGPQSSKRYLPMLTSRGCPYPCGFCVVPATNNRKWRSRSAKNIVDEMEYLIDTFKVTEFHIEDLNPTINDKRTRAICNEIINRGLNISWKIVAGTKIESIVSEQTIDLMAQSGCRYISMSPESGSARVLKLMNKPFKNDHAVRLIKQMNKVGIRSQACFVLGFPGEETEDRKMTWNLVKNLVRCGLDEIALFIVSPVPGSKIFEEYTGYNSLSDLNFTPTWRKDYTMLSQYRINLYRAFLLWKLIYHPRKIIRQMLNFLLRRFETKMEMVPYKAIVWKLTEFNRK